VQLQRQLQNSGVCPVKPRSGANNTLAVFHLPAAALWPLPASLPACTPSLVSASYYRGSYTLSRGNTSAVMPSSAPNREAA